MSIDISLVLYESEDILCVADREGESVDCVGAGLTQAEFRVSVWRRVRGVGRVLGLTGTSPSLLTVGLEESTVKVSRI